MLVISQICSFIFHLLLFPPTDLFPCPLVFFLSLSLKLLENCFEIHLTYKKTILSTLLSSPEFERIFPVILCGRSCLARALHCLVVQNPPAQKKFATRADAAAFTQIHPTSETCTRDLDEPGKWLTFHLSATERKPAA